jgi:hypothetical protein
MSKLHLRRRLLVGGAFVAAAGLGLAAPAAAGVSADAAFYVDGQTYRTVATPTDLTGTGAPDHSWDVIYDFGGAQLNVAEAAPGTAGYNGGRWQVHGLSFPAGYGAAVAAGDLDGDGVLDSAAEVGAAMDAGAAVDVGVVAQFVCPVIPFPANR